LILLDNSSRSDLGPDRGAVHDLYFWYDRYRSMGLKASRTGRPDLVGCRRPTSKGARTLRLRPKAPTVHLTEERNFNPNAGGNEA
jgi:hypothetical protein